MSVALKLTSYPDFDFSEIINEPDLFYRPFRSVDPVKAGANMPDFTFQKDSSRWQQFFNGAESHGPALLNQLLNRPLIIAFYSKHWRAYGIDLLKRLNAIQPEIKSHGGNILVISAEKENDLEKIAWENNLSLNFYFDTENEIAEKFRIYSDHDPIWNKFSGIDTNVPLLAAYVISITGKVDYAYVEQDFSGAFPDKEILTSVRRNSNADDNKIRNINSGNWQESQYGSRGH